MLLEIARRSLIGTHPHIWNDPEHPVQGHDSAVLHLVGQIDELAGLVEEYVSHTLDDDTVEF